MTCFHAGRLTHVRHSARRRVSAGSKVDAAAFCTPVSPGHAVRHTKAARNSASNTFAPPPASEKAAGFALFAPLYTLPSPPPPSALCAKIAA